MTLKIISVLSPELTAKIKGYLDATIASQLQSDVSNYAKGRKNLWLQYKANLAYPKRGEAYTPGLKDDRIWQFCQRIFPSADVGLITRSDNFQGISWHRDAKYASPIAMSINLGKCRWLYCDEKSGRHKTDSSDKVPLGVDEHSDNYDCLDLSGGEIIQFNCKNLHAVEPLEDDRYSINLWSVKIPIPDGL